MTTDPQNINIDNLQQCSLQDRADIYKLELATLALVITARKTQFKKFLSATLMHTLGTANGIYSIILMRNNDKLLAIIYALLMLGWARIGFIKGDIKNIAKRDFYESLDLYNRLKNVLETTNPKQIHDIAETYRKHFPDIDDLTPDNIKSALNKIMLKYER